MLLWAIAAFIDQSVFVDGWVGKPDFSANRGAQTMTCESRVLGIAIGLAAFLITTALAVAPGAAQQITGEPGSPSATTTIDGRYLPPPPPPFGGTINLGTEQSKPYWPPKVVPPAGAPNVLLIMTDDQGYGVSGTFGGVIPTPSLDRIAQMGLRYTQFHSTALCSPTRAALITGRPRKKIDWSAVAKAAHCGEATPAPITTPV
jgi:hypothetical protein